MGCQRFGDCLLPLAVDETLKLFMGGYGLAVFQLLFEYRSHAEHKLKDACTVHNSVNSEIEIAHLKLNQLAEETDVYTNLRVYRV